MIYDCFTFFNELDLLEIRLNVLKDVVDKFVLVEATKTHTGQSKPLYYLDNKERFADFNARIIHIVVDDFSMADGATNPREHAWAIENIQRNAAAQGLSGAAHGDKILISDLDEIPDPKHITAAINLPGVIRFGMKAYYYYLNFRNCTSRTWTLGTQMISVGDFQNPTTFAKDTLGEFTPQFVNQSPTLSLLRFHKQTRMLKNAGWHFSYQGGIAAIQKKIKSIAHTEFANEKTTSEEFIRARIKNGEDPFLRGDRFFAEPLDNSFPDYLRNHADKYKSMILPVDEAYLSRTRAARLLTSIKGEIRQGAIACVPTWAVPAAVRLRNAIFKSRIS